MNEIKILRGAVTLLVSALLGCTTAEESLSGTSTDASADAAASCPAASPPLGFDPGSQQSFPDLEWTACDGTKTTVDEIRCGSSLTVISIGAGWCEPCRTETPLLEAAQAQWADDGVQIVQVLYQDVQSNPATTLFCQQWVTELGLTIEVYVDPVGRSLEHFDVAQTPLNVAIRPDGRVLWAESGVPEDLSSTIGQLLAELADDR